MPTPYADFTKELIAAIPGAPDPYNILLARCAIAIAKLQQWLDIAAKATAMAQDVAIKNKTLTEQLDLALDTIESRQRNNDTLRTENNRLADEIGAIKSKLAEAETVSSTSHDAWLKAMGKVGDLEAELAALRAQEPSGYTAELNPNVPMGVIVWTKPSSEHPYPVYAAAGAAPAKPLTDEQWLEYLLRHADKSVLHVAAIVGGSIQNQGKWVLQADANNLRKLVEAAHGIKGGATPDNREERLKSALGQVFNWPHEEQPDGTIIPVDPSEMQP